MAALRRPIPGDQGAFLGVMPWSPWSAAAVGLCAPVLSGTGL